MNGWHLKQAVRVLKKGGIIAYPTESIYGLGCDPMNEKAVKRLLLLKKRSWEKGLILIAADFVQVQKFLKPLSPTMEKQVFATWPGAVTWLLPAKDNVPKELRGQSDKLAVRITAHPQVFDLCRLFEGALVSTSANLSGRPAAKTSLAVRRSLGDSVEYILHGAVGKRIRPSEIRDALTNAIIRA